MSIKSDGYSWIGQKDGVIYNYEDHINLGQPYPYMDFSLNVGDELVIYEKEFDEEGDSMVTEDHRGRSFLTARLTGICYGVIQKVRKNEL